MPRSKPTASRSSLTRPSLTETPLRVRPGGKKFTARAPKSVGGSAAVRTGVTGLSQKISRASAPRSAPSRGTSAASRTPGAGYAFHTKARGLMPARSAQPRRQRVVVKVRIVRNRGPDGRRTLPRHIDYVERDGVSVEGGRGESFGRDGLLAESDVAGFLERTRDDRHHFRIIVTPERGGDLDLRRTTQSWMTEVEADLGTRVEWLAVEHHNTAHPHVHVIVRGVDDQGSDLLIRRQYITHGLRGRAEEVVTRTLGLRSEREVARERARELVVDRLTYIDRRMIREAEDAKGVVDVRPVEKDPTGNRTAFLAQKQARLRYLKSQGLAKPAGERPSAIWGCPCEAPLLT